MFGLLCLFRICALLVPLVSAARVRQSPDTGGKRWRAICDIDGIELVVGPNWYHKIGSDEDLSRNHFLVLPPDRRTLYVNVDDVAELGDQADEYLVYEGMQPVAIKRDLVGLRHSTKRQLAASWAGQGPWQDLLDRAIQEVPRVNALRFRNRTEFLGLLEDVLVSAPSYNINIWPGLPLSNLLVSLMATPTGVQLFKRRDFNQELRGVLALWTQFLNSPDSLYVLNDGPTGWKAIERNEHLFGMEEYEHLISDTHWGFRSWNDFFTRHLKPGLREIATDVPVVAPCDSYPYRYAANLQLNTSFVAKEEQYSLLDMFDGDLSLAQSFVGGSLLQSFLSIYLYHRWHSPMSGKILQVKRINGFMFSEDESDAEAMADASYAQEDWFNLDQQRIPHVNTRSILVISGETYNVAVIFVGMAEISSCIFHERIKSGYEVTKGEEIGMFQFGGSTTLVIVPPGVDILQREAEEVVRLGKPLAK